MDADNAADPAMSEYHRRILTALRAAFPWPYSVFKVREGLLNDAKLTWNPDFWVEKNGRKVMLISALGSDTSAQTLDSRMKDAYATMAFLDNYRGRIALSAPRSALIVPDPAILGIAEERFMVYIHLFEEVRCEVLTEKNLGELEIYRDDEDRGVKSKG